METTQHTKGEWRINRTGQDNIIHIDARRPNERQTILTIETPTEIESLANAKLIVAAPELLKQIKNMYDLAEMMGMKMLSEEWDEQFRTVYNQVMQNAEFLYSEQGININE